MDAKATEPQETVLPWLPFEVGRYCDAREAIVFNEYLCFLVYAVFEEGSHPGIQPTGHVDRCCCDKIVPISVSDNYEVRNSTEEHTMR